MKISSITVLLLTLSLSSSLNRIVLSKQNRSIGARIIGGQNAYAGQFKFAAAINVQTSNSKFFCVGALLTEQFILTAGHCVDGAVLFTIQLGSNSLTAEDSNRVTVATSEYILHPDYDPMTLQNDIGLIKLRLPVELTNYINTIHYLPTTPIQVSTGFIAIGWGQIDDENSELSDHLQWVQITSISNEECRLTYGNQITDNMVCVAGNYNEGTCIGDSGGPLIHVVSRGEMVQTGISSFVSGNGCQSTDPSGYARIYTYLEWIKNITTV